MSTLQVEHLANLLERAIGSVVITHDRWNQRIDVPTYRKNLLSYWERHWPVLDLNHPTHYVPELTDNGLKEQLLATVGQELGQHVRDGRVQTAAIVTVGGYGPGFALDDLVRRLVEVAIGRGPWHAASAFFEGVEGGDVTYRDIALLTGVRLDHEVEIRPGIRLVPLPTSTADLPAYFPPHGSYMDSGDLLGKTLMVVDRTVRPVFADPDPLSLPEDVFQRQQGSSEIPDLNVDQFCDALSLANKGAIELVADWNHVDPDAIFIPKWSYTGGERLYTYPLVLYREHSVVANEDSVEEAVSLYEARKSLSPGLARRLEVPIKRWIKSQTDQSLVDAFIDLGIVLESLYLDDGRESELGFRLRLRAGWFLGNSVEERDSVMNNIRDIYELRSGAVHAGQVPDVHKTRQIRDIKDEAVDLCMRSIVKKIHHARAYGEFPNWNRLVLGDDNEN